MKNSDYKSFYLYQPPSNYKKIRNILIITILSTAFIILLESIVYYYQHANLDLHNQMSSSAKLETNLAALLSPPASPKTNYGPIAQKSLDCLNTLRDERNLFLFAKICQNGQCTDAPSSHSGPRPIWAKYKHYQLTKNPSEFESIKHDLLNQQSKSQIMQNDFWNCKLMYEMYLDPAFTPDQKQIIKNICLIGLNNPEITNKVNTNSKLYDPSSIDQLYHQIALGQMDQVSSVADFKDSSLFELSYLVSEYTNRYNLDHQDNNLKSAQYLFEDNLKVFINRDVDEHKDICTLGEASLDLYKTTENSTYLRLAEYIWNAGKVYSLVSNINNNIYTQSVCAIFSGHLYQNTKNNTYDKAKTQILDQLIKNNLNEQDGCFVETDADGTYEFTTENSLLIGLMSE